VRCWSSGVVDARAPRRGCRRAAAHVARYARIRYIYRMAKRKRVMKKSTGAGFVLGEASFAKISAVEGIRLKPAMKQRATRAASQGLSPEQYREAIVRAHRKG